MNVSVRCRYIFMVEFQINGLSEQRKFMGYMDDIMCCYNMCVVINEKCHLIFEKFI